MLGPTLKNDHHEILEVVTSVLIMCNSESINMMLNKLSKNMVFF
jgi:hypothetical protein